MRKQTAFHNAQTFRLAARSMSEMGQTRKSSVGLGMSAVGGRAEVDFGRLEVSVANSYSRGDREFEKATAMLFPSEIAQRGRVRNHTAAPFRRRVYV